MHECSLLYDLIGLLNLKRDLVVATIRTSRSVLYNSLRQRRIAVTDCEMADPFRYTS